MYGPLRELAPPANFVRCLRRTGRSHYCFVNGRRSRPTTSGEARTMAADEQDQVTVKFLTVAEVAKIMRVSKMTVYRLVHSGELPAARVGRSFRVPERAVQEYLRRSLDETG